MLECRLIVAALDMNEFDLSPDEVRRLGYSAADAVAEHRASLLDRPVFGKIGAKAAGSECVRMARVITEDGL